jgi:hypothetical protein
MPFLPPPPLVQRLGWFNDHPPGHRRCFPRSSSFFLVQDRFVDLLVSDIITAIKFGERSAAISARCQTRAKYIQISFLNIEKLRYDEIPWYQMCSYRGNCNLGWKPASDGGAVLFPTIKNSNHTIFGCSLQVVRLHLFLRLLHRGTGDRPCR